MPFERDPNELGVLWEKDSTRGKYFTGQIGDQKVVVFRNGNKKSDKQPDWRILKSKPREAQPADEDIAF